MYRIAVWVWLRANRPSKRSSDERAQTVAEYALVLLVAAAVAAAFLLWARSSGQLDSFFDAIFEKLLGSVEAEPTPTPTPA